MHFQENFEITSKIYKMNHIFFSMSVCYTGYGAFISGHDYFLNRDLYFLHPNFNSENRKTQMHIPTGDEFNKDGFNSYYSDSVL